MRTSRRIPGPIGALVAAAACPKQAITVVEESVGTDPTPRAGSGYFAAGGAGWPQR